MAAKVKCLFCNEIFDREKVPCVKIGRRYAHVYCAEQEDHSLVQEEKDKEKFYEMVKSIYGNDYNFLKINKQATSFIQQYGYTWSGMTGCLHWFYNINHGNLEEGHGGIGIIPFIYEDCRKYYQELYKMQEKNKSIGDKLRMPVNFSIQSPRAWQRPPHLLNLED
jgi:hypothetical protein